MRYKELVFITSNQNKLREVEQILGMKLRHKDLDISEIQDIEVRKVIEEKAKSAYRLVGEPVLVEDSGLYINALNRFPGALIKWVLHSIGNEGICRLLLDKEDRSAYAEACFGVYDGKELHAFSGIAKGMIVEAPRGASGFGWDPIFQPDEHQLTFAEMGSAEKNKISHRNKALEQLRGFLES